MRRQLFACIVMLGLGATAGCGSSNSNGDAGHTGPGGSCDLIIEACHPVDTGSGPISVCHDVAHDGPVEMCDARLAECVALCTAAATDGGLIDASVDDAAVDSGNPQSDAAIDAGPPTACMMLGTLCHPYDTGSGPAHDCHEVGHTGDTAACAAELAACTAICSGDAGAHVHDVDAGTLDAAL